MEIFDTIASVRRFAGSVKSAGRTVALVPTMGALHDGHRSCIEIARSRGDAVVVSIFVNPTQFDSAEDLAGYPTRLEHDENLCEQWGCDAVFVPRVEEIYASGQRTWIEVDDLAEPLCGRTRKNHFRGVVTVVVKLFNIIQPDIAVFGQKDAQQALVIRRAVEQLNLDVELVLSRIAREADGLAFSSRNQRLSERNRKQAPTIYAGLKAGVAALRSGERRVEAVHHVIEEILATAENADVEYVEVLNAYELTNVETAAGRLILAVAVHFDDVRLIDNVVVNIDDSGEVAEVLLF